MDRKRTANVKKFNKIFLYEAIAKRDKKLLQFVNAGYDTMHITMGYDGNQSKNVCDEGIRLANSIIKRCSAMMKKNIKKRRDARSASLQPQGNNSPKNNINQNAIFLLHILYQTDRTTIVARFTAHSS